MKLNPSDANLISIFIRQLKPGKNYNDFYNAWKPEKGFGFPVRVLNAVSQNDDKEIISIGFMKLPEDKMSETIARISEQELVRHERIEDIIESTNLKGIFRIIDDEDLS